MNLTKWAVVNEDNSEITLKDGKRDRVVSITKTKDGKIHIGEECDRYFSVELSKEDAKIALLEAISWIDNDTFNKSDSN